jgi:hypothetical protein
MTLNRPLATSPGQFNRAVPKPFWTAVRRKAPSSWLGREPHSHTRANHISFPLMRGAFSSARIIGDYQRGLLRARCESLEFPNEIVCTVYRVYCAVYQVHGALYYNTLIDMH